MSEKARQNVINVRHISTSYLFTDARTGLADASISIGTIYEGADLKVSRPFCELSLKWKKDQLVNSVRDQVKKFSLMIQFKLRVVHKWRHMSRGYRIVWQQYIAFSAKILDNGEDGGLNVRDVIYRRTFVENKSFWHLKLIAYN